MNRRAAQAATGSAEAFADVMDGCGFGPDDRWPCGDCAFITSEHDAGRGRVVRRISHLQTCQACRDAGAPDTLPW